MDRNFTLLNADQANCYGIDSRLSFLKFINNVQQQAERERTGRKHLSEFILDHVGKNPHWLNPPNINDLQPYDGLLELIYTLLVSPFADEEQTYWGLGLPFVPSVFFGTEGLYQFIERKASGQYRVVTKPEDEEEMKERQLRAAYSFILHQFYHFPSFKKFDFVHAVDEGKDGIHYMRVELDLSFVSVYAKGSLPALDLDRLRLKQLDTESLNYLKTELPLSLFYFEGFSVLTARDASFEYVMGEIKEAIAGHQGADRLPTIVNVLKLFKSLIADKQVEFGLLPLPQLNGKLAVPYTLKNPLSLLTKYGVNAHIKERAFIETLEEYQKQPRLLVVKKEEEDDQPRTLLHEIIEPTPFKALTIVPVFHNRDLVGILEAYTYHGNGLGEQCLGRVTLALPLLSQLVKKTLEEFEITIGQVVNEGFTSIQTAVEWKFKETAWRHLKRYGTDYYKHEMGKVSFEQLCPLYGAIDIRNSTVERNHALKMDLQEQMTLLHSIISDVCKNMSSEEWNQTKLQCEEWLTRLAGPFSSTLEHNMAKFLQQDIHPRLEQLRQLSPEKSKAIDTYLYTLDRSGRGIQQHRHELEESIQLVNRTLATHLIQLKARMSTRFASYFETFRTDGLEYDVYVGQSIAPDKEFDDTVVRDFRVMQLESMAEVVQSMRELVAQMPVPLQTTQLIFVHENPIDISFRNDEKRFGVEGAYNIRYEILKKRIDKVHVHHTGERLTQPGKIAIVYFDDQIVEEYTGYINTLQQQGKLADDLEFLELEELQGVNGLKALRVGVPLLAPRSQNQDGIQNEAILQNLL